MSVCDARHDGFLIQNSSAGAPCSAKRVGPRASFAWELGHHGHPESDAGLLG